ncbi:uncharacterized protein KRP23_1201 [Phytophthora ramorum]|uniref:Uncharacterized protein n=1 Tax=Phytophthora ramorum TaxID=164328 RepID=H3H0R5_PHYRM|nr:hypothetical protein KRP23_1201 [Phytophthora ramorum]
MATSAKRIKLTKRPEPLVIDPDHPVTLWALTVANARGLNYEIAMLVSQFLTPSYLNLDKISKNKLELIASRFLIRNCSVIYSFRCWVGASIEMMKCFRRANIRMHTTLALEEAAYNGHLDVVKWLYANNCSKYWAIDAMDLAAENGQLDVVKPIRMNG